jgi:Tfp pilus assembly protein PilF
MATNGAMENPTVEASKQQDPPALRRMDPSEFAGHIKSRVTEDSRYRYAFFLGAGCSISSGIPAAAALVREWMRELKKQETASAGRLAEWAAEKFAGYSDGNAARYYPRVIEELFSTDQQRQSEIERRTKAAVPGFGYSVLALLMSHKALGTHYNVALTTNFDDLLSDAVYLYADRKALVISHDSLIGFARSTLANPLILKLHGDARLAPRNTDLQTKALDAAVSKVLAGLLKEMGLVFIGYGGNDVGILRMLERLPADALPWGVYWVASELPSSTGMLSWLIKRKAVWVTHRDFDQLMLLLRSEFDLAHPDKARFDRLWQSYDESFKALTDEVSREAIGRDLARAAEKAATDLDPWRVVENRAAKFERKEPSKAAEIYEQGLKRFPQSSELMENYAVLLSDELKEYEHAEKLYLAAIDADPKEPVYLGNYALFLWESREDYEQADTYFRKSITSSPNDATYLGNYANFLSDVLRDLKGAEQLYLRAIAADPRHALNLGNYASFLWLERARYDDADKYYRKAIEADGHNATNLNNYAGFLLARGQSRRGFAFLARARQEGATADPVLVLEGAFYEYAHGRDEATRAQALVVLKRVLAKKVVSPGWSLSRNVRRAVADKHPDTRFLRQLGRVVSGEAPLSVLAPFKIWRDVNISKTKARKLHSI